MYLTNILKILKYKITGKKLIIINESAGLGDYLWVRNYFRLLKNHPKFGEYKIVMCATERWLDFALEADSDCVDIFLPFSNPNKPKFKELLPLILFKYDVSINFRESGKEWKTITKFLHSKLRINDTEERKNVLFYEDLNNLIVSKLVNIPKDFRHTINVEENINDEFINKDYFILTPGGYSQGKLTLNQIECIIKSIFERDGVCRNYNAVILGTKNDAEIFYELQKRLPENISKKLINCCGKYKIIQLPLIIHKSKFVITTNTSIWHFCLMLKKKHIIISLESPALYTISDKCFPNKNDIKYITTEESITSIEPEILEEKITKAISELQ